MSASRRLSAVLLVLTACAGWETAAPSNTPPPADSPTPSHYAPPPPVDPREPSTSPVPAGSVQVAIASVQLIEDCPDPAPAAEKPTVQGLEAGAALPNERSSMMKQPAGARMRGDSPDGVYRPPCTQSMVQMSVRADFVGDFRVEAVRVLDGGGKQVVGTTTLRGPTLWSDANGTYAPWDGRTVAGQELKISYKLGELDLSQAGAGSGPSIGAFGPYVLEVDVAVDGRRQTIRSSEFTREPPHVMVT